MIRKNEEKINFFPFFQDIKKYKFSYFFAYPTLSQTVATTVDPLADTDIKTCFTTDQLKEFNFLYQDIGGQSNKSFFILEKHTDKLLVRNLNEVISHMVKESNFKDIDLNSIYFCYSDMTSHECAGWPLRLFLVGLVHLW